MALPRIDTPTYQTTLLSTGETIQFRPFLVKEQKVIMMAQESNEEVQITNALVSLVSTCTFGKVDVENIPTFDVENLFLRIRGKSVGESVDINITCPDDDVTKVPIKVNLDDIKLQTSPDHNPVIDITDSIKMYLSYPTFRNTKNIPNVNSSEGLFKILYTCINEIHYGDDVYNRIDISDKDIEDFIDQLTGEQFEKVTNFFLSMPKLRHTIEVVNPKTKVKSEVVLEGLQSFLG